MKIFMISNMYPSNHDATYGVFVKNFETDMSRRGVGFRKAVIEGKGKNVLDKVRKYFHFVIDIYTALFKKDVDLIYVHYISHSLLPLLPVMPFIRRPVVINAHGSDLLPTKILSKLILSINHYTITRSAMVVVPSEYFREIIMKKYSHHNIHVSPSGGIDLSLFYNRKHESGNYKGLRLGYVSRLEAGKGWDVFLNSLLILRDNNPYIRFNAIMVGGGSQEDKLQHEINKNGLEEYVTYLGVKKQRELPEIFSDMDLFIFPTQLKESLGLVGLEAMACGTPVVGSRIGGLVSYIDDGINGYLFEPGNALQLASIYLKYYGLDMEAKERISSSAIETAKAYDKNIVGEKLFKKVSGLTL